MSKKPRLAMYCTFKVTEQFFNGVCVQVLEINVLTHYEFLLEQMKYVKGGKCVRIFKKCCSNAVNT